MQEVQGGYATFAVNSALGRFLRVRKNAGVLALAGATDTDSVGTTTRTVNAGETATTVRLVNDAGIHVMIAGGAISDGADVFAAAAGKVASTGTVLVGVANSAAGADGDQIEVIPTFRQALT